MVHDDIYAYSSVQNEGSSLYLPVAMANQSISAPLMMAVFLYSCTCLTQADHTRSWLNYPNQKLNVTWQRRRRTALTDNLPYQWAEAKTPLETVGGMSGTEKA